MSGYYEGLPDVRTSLRGTSPDGNEIWLIRSISQKLYRCPECYAEIGIGAEHIVVQEVQRIGGTRHTHWHRACVERTLIHQLRGIQTATAAETRPGKLAGRGRQTPGRRRTPRRGR